MSLLGLSKMFRTTDACPSWCPCTNEIESDEYDRYPEFFALIGVHPDAPCEATDSPSADDSATAAPPASRASSVSDRSTP